MRPPTKQQLDELQRIAAAFTLDEAAAHRLTVRALHAFPEPAKASETRLYHALWLGAQADRTPANDDAPPNLPGLRDDPDANADAIALLRAARSLDAMTRDALVCHYAGVLAPERLARAHQTPPDETRERLAAGERAIAGDPTAFDAARARDQLGRAFASLSIDHADPDVTRAIAAAQRRSKLQTALGGLALLVLIVGMSLVIRDLLGWDERKEALDALSNPLPEERADDNLTPANRRRTLPPADVR